MKLEGMDKVLANLNRAIAGIQGRTYAGLLKAGLFVQGEAQRETPVDTGALKSSAYTQGIQKGENPIVEIGFTSAYAPFVHEINKNYRVGNWQFLRNALAKNDGKILDIIRQEAKIP
jgi:hypothetical protein